MNLATTPRQMALDVYAQWDADYDRKVRQRRAVVESGIRSNPALLGLALAKWFAEEPQTVGQAIQAFLAQPQRNADIALRMVIDTAVLRAVEEATS